MNTPACSLLRALRFLAALALSAFGSLQADTVTFVGDGDKKGLPSNFLDSALWNPAVLPGPGDDIIATDSYMHDTPPTVLRFRSLLHERNARGFYVRASLVFAEDVELRSSLELQREHATLTWGNQLSVGLPGDATPCDVSLVGGLATDNKAQPAPRLIGKSLMFEANARLRLRWFKDVPSAMPGNQVPLVRLTDTATFVPGATLRIQFEKLDDGAEFLPGEYLLLSASAIKGPLPKLDIVDAPASTKPKAELRISPDKRRLVLVVTPVR